MADFAELGLSGRLMEAARSAGYETPSPLQAAAYAVLRRGGNVVLRASAGAGVTGAWGLPLLERLSGDVGADAAGESQDTRASDDAGAGAPRALVLAPTLDRAESISRELGRLAAGSGIAVRVTRPGWSLAGADVVVTTSIRAMAEVSGSSLKLDGVETLVLADAADLIRLEGLDALNTLVALIPKDAQRVVASGESMQDLDRWIDAQVRRAISVPARPADPQVAAAAEPVGQIGFVVVTAAEKLDILARLVDGVDEQLAIHARTVTRANLVRDGLVARGVVKSERVEAGSFDTDVRPAARVVSFDVPFSAEQLRRIHETGGTVMVEPAELAHFRRIAAEVPFTVRQRKARTLNESALDAYRTALRAAVAEEDLGAQMLVLAPLFEEYSPAELAAAMSALLRRRPAAALAPAGASVVGESAGAAAPSRQPGGLTRLFMGIGTKENIRPGDLVGAITGEAGIRGDQVGRVDIREAFSVVEVASEVADRVIRALNGTTMKGRALRVDYDRKMSSGGRSEERGPRGRDGAPRGRDGAPRGRDGAPRGRDGGPRGRDGGDRPGDRSGRGGPRPAGGRTPGREPGGMRRDGPPRGDGPPRRRRPE